MIDGDEYNALTHVGRRVHKFKPRQRARVTVATIAG
jgi:hypothetical protein